MDRLESTRSESASKPKIRGSNTETAIIFVNGTKTEIAYYWVDGEGEEKRYGKIAAGDFVNQHTYSGHIWLVKDANGDNLAVFRAEEKTGRALVGAELLDGQ
jgi:dipeptidyl-peptidase-4